MRLALRHPAAAEKLAGPAVEGEDARTRIELVGLGGADRQWTMTVTRLPDGSRLVRLGDLSQTRAAEQMRVDFVANASHELRTPLATLLGFLETLQDEDAAGDPATRERFLAIMFNEAKRMRGLVDDLMSLSRIEAERFAVPADPVDLLPLIDETRTSLRQLVDERGSTLVLENDAGEAIVTGDRPQLAQMLGNLLVNSLKYGRAGAPIRINLDNAGSELIRLRVTDEGEGIAPEHIPRLTERFYRVDPGAAARSEEPDWGSPSSSISCCATAADSTSGASLAKAPRYMSICRVRETAKCNKTVMRMTLIRHLDFLSP